MFQMARLCLLSAALLCWQTNATSWLRIGVPAELDTTSFDWWSGWTETNVTVILLNNSRDGFDLLQADQIDLFLAVELNSLCFGGYDMAVQQLAVAFTEGLRWSTNADELNPVTILLPPAVLESPSRLLQARLQLALDHGIDLAEHKIIVAHMASPFNATYTALVAPNSTGLQVPTAIWQVAQRVPRELRTRIATAISGHDLSSLNWTQDWRDLYQTRLAIYETFKLPEHSFCSSLSAMAALACSNGIETSGNCATCPDEAEQCLCSACADPTLPEVQVMGVRRQDHYHQTTIQRCYHQQTCVAVEAGEVILFAASTEFAQALNNLTATSYHDESLVQLDRLSTNVTLLRYTPNSVGLHVIHLTLPAMTMDIGILVKPWNCDPAADVGCSCPSGTYAHADTCVAMGKLAELVLVPIVILLISLGLMIAQSKVSANQAWSIGPSEIMFSNPPEILGAGSFGVVIKGLFRGTAVAVKQALPDRTATQMMESRKSGAPIRSLFGRNQSSKDPAPIKLSTTSLSSMRSETSIDEAAPRIPSKPSSRKQSQASRGYLEQVRQQLGSKDQNQGGEVADDAPSRGVRRIRTRATMNPTVVTIQEDEETQDIPTAPIKGKFLSQIKRARGVGSMGMTSAHTSKRTKSLMSLRTSRSTRMRLLKDELLDEMAVLSRLRHPNITTIIGCCVEKGVIPLLVLEYLELGSLYDLLHNSTIDVDGDVSVPILKDIASGLAYLHGSRPPIIHADLKSANVLVDANFKAKLTDFGLSSRRHLGAVGTPFWMAPELLLDDTPSPSSDIYAFGVVLFEVLTAQVPYAEEDTVEVLQKIMSRHEPPKRPTMPAAIVPPEALRLLMEACWDNSALKRPVASAILETIKSLDASESYILKKKEESKLQLRVLNDVFPEHIAKALAEGRKVEPEKKPNVTIFFSDIVGFTNISSMLSPIKVSQMLDRLYRAFDELSYIHDIYKVETIGDAFMGATNLIRDQADHTVRMGRFALSAIEAAHATLIDEDDPSLGCINIRVGIHCGPIVANVVGSRNPRYCLFGDTVNTASRMESNSEKNKVQLSAHAAVAMKKQSYTDLKLIKRGKIPIKGKGLMTTYWLIRRSKGDRKASALSVQSACSEDPEELEAPSGMAPFSTGAGQSETEGSVVVMLEPGFETAEL